MKDLFTKIDYYVDYGNHYSIRRALTTLGREFEIAMSRNNGEHARAAISAVRQMYDKLSLTYRESEDWGETMSYSQKLLAQRMRRFIAYLTNRLKQKSGIKDREQEIEEILV